MCIYRNKKKHTKKKKQKKFGNTNSTSLPTMSSDNDLKHALAVTPFAHMVPKQGLYGLVCPLPLPQVESPDTKHGIKQIDLDSEEVMTLLGNDLLEANDPAVFFREFLKTHHPTSSPIPLASTELQLLKSPIHYVNPLSTSVQCPRLSVRKKYNPTEMDHHNKTYEKKFNKASTSELKVKRPSPPPPAPETARKLVKLAPTTPNLTDLLDNKSFEEILGLINAPGIDLNIDQSKRVLSVCKSYLSTTKDHTLASLSACVCIATIMNKNVFNMSFRVDDTFTEVGACVYRFVHTILPDSSDLDILNLCKLLRELGFIGTGALCDEDSLTKLEISAIHILFEELFPTNDFSLLRHAAASFITDVYHGCHTQRRFLLNELSTNFLRLPTKKTEARNYRTHRGFNILVFTTVAIKFSQEEDDANVLAGELILRVTTNFDTTAKSLLELLVEDLIQLLRFCEWAASAALLSGLANAMLTTNTPQLEVFFLELLGTICANVYDIKKHMGPTIYQELSDECTRYGTETDVVYMTKMFGSSKKSYIELLLHDLDKFCNSFLTSLCKWLNSPKIKLKTKAVKVLSLLSDKQPNLLNSKVLQLALSARLCDDATLVRDAVYEFIGKYIKAHPKEADNFHTSLCNALSDEGVSVRKKAIRLTKEIYPMFSKTSRISIAAKMLKRLNDEEESIQKEAASMLVGCWMTPSNQAISEMITLAMSHHKTQEALQTFLDGYVLQENSVDFLIDTLLDMVGDDSSSKEGPLLLLSVCSTSKPQLVGQDQLIALQPFLTDSNNITTKSYQYGLRILKSVLPLISSLRPQFIDPVQEFLFAKLTKMTKKELHEAVPSLWQLCKIKLDFTKLVNAVISTMKMIWKYKLEPDVRLAKLIQLLACLVKHCDLEPFHDMFLKANLGLKKNETVVSLAVKYILTFCDKSSSVRSSAVTNLLVACSNSPRILMSPPVLTVFDQSLDSTPETIKSLLQTMIDFIQERDKVSVAATTSLEDIVDDACPGLVQRYIERILALSLADKGQLAYLPFQFVQVALDLGFANPKICISTIIALEASLETIVHCSAVAMHQKLFDKHESLVDSNYHESIRKAYDAGLTSPSFFNSIYTIIYRSKTSRNKFLIALTKVLTLGNARFLLFCVNRIAATNFKFTEDVLVVLTHLQDQIRVDGADLDQPQAISICALIELYRHLTTAYKISDEQVEAYATGASDIDSKHPIKTKTHDRLDLTWITENLNNPSCLAECVETITKFT